MRGAWVVRAHREVTLCGVVVQLARHEASHRLSIRYHTITSNFAVSHTISFFFFATALTTHSTLLYHLSLTLL